MKVLSTDGLTKLIQLIKSTFIPNTDVEQTTEIDTEQTSEVTLATVATTGDYNDLSNKPTIPTVNNAILTITQGGTTKGTFTANASSNVTIALDAGGSSSVWGSITGTLSDQTDLQTVLNAKQDTLTAGSNITISGSTISATDTTYTAGTGIDITNDEISTVDMQTTTNLVTSVSASSTDAQYPSAKLFYDTVGDIETALHTINSGGA